MDKNGIFIQKDTDKIFDKTRDRAVKQSALNPWAGDNVPDIKAPSRKISTPDFIKRCYGRDSSSHNDRSKRVQQKINEFNEFLTKIRGNEVFLENLDISVKNDFRKKSYRSD